MADLRDVVGAILRDVTEARGQADEASRDMAMAYARDPILRAFTVPRIDIRDLHIDLKVAVRGVEESSDDRASRGHRIAESVRKNLKTLSFPVEERTTSALAAQPSPTFTREMIVRELDSSVKQAATKNAEALKMEVYRDVLLVAENDDKDISIAAFTTETVVPSTRFASFTDARKGADLVAKLRPGQSLSPQQQKAAESLMRSERSAYLNKLLTLYSDQAAACASLIQTEVAKIMSAPSEKRVNVDVATAELKDIPAHMISTISITLDVNGVLPTQSEEV